jgi:hypothetical protein
MTLNVGGTPMSSKLFVSASLISLALVSVGCNANLSTGHPTAKPAAANATTPGAAITPANKAAVNTSPAVATGKVGLMDSELSGTFTCDSDRSADKCLTGETAVVSDDLKSVTISWTGNVGKSSTSCDQVQVIKMDPTTATIADDGTSTSNNTATVTATFQPITLGANSTSVDCQAALKALTPNTSGKNPIALQIDQYKVANDELHLTVPSESLDLRLARASASDEAPAVASTPTTATETKSDAPAATAAASANGAQPAEVVNPLDDGKAEH